MGQGGIVTVSNGSGTIVGRKGVAKGSGSGVGGGHACGQVSGGGPMARGQVSGGGPSARG